MGSLMMIFPAMMRPSSSTTAPASGTDGAALVVFAPAKLNLFLHVLGRCSDTGLHRLQSLFVFLTLGDELTFTPAATTDLRMHPDLGLTREQNLAWRALEMVQRLALDLPPVQVDIRKAVPAEAGLGGGTADAAAVVHWAEKQRKPKARHQWDSGPRREPNFRACAAELGADMPPAMDQTARLWGGTGDQPGPAVRGLSGVPVLLLKPPGGVSTGACFAALKGRFGAAVPWSDYAGATAMDQLAGTRNDLQSPACMLNPDISLALDQLSALDGAWLVRMTGSGSTCFALFHEKGPRDAALAQLQHSNPTWWVAGAEIL